MIYITLLSIMFKSKMSVIVGGANKVVVYIHSIFEVLGIISEKQKRSSK